MVAERGSHRVDDGGNRGEIEERLKLERRRTEAEIASLSEAFNDIVEGSALVSTDDEHDPEGATIAFERQQVAALRAEARRHLIDVADAEARLRDGGYGICVECEGPVGTDRLEARPAAARCVSCAARGG